MVRDTDVVVTGVSLYLLPVETRMPLKFGSETLTHVTCARVALQVTDTAGCEVVGWGETPLSVQWVWPAVLSYGVRCRNLELFCERLAKAWRQFSYSGHALEIGHAFQQEMLPTLLVDFQHARRIKMPWLAALVCCSAFDIALHDAYGIAHGVSVYSTYNDSYLNTDLTRYLVPAVGTDISFRGQFPSDFLVQPLQDKLPAWHLVGGVDPLSDADLEGVEPNDGYPVHLGQWIGTDGLTCLKVKLRGDDADWDYDRLVSVGMIAVDNGVSWLSSDFNCMVTKSAYVNDILDRLMLEHPRLYGMLLYVEQPFPYDLEESRIDVHSVSARKPLFMDESAHDWRMVRLGRSLGWTGVALKTCKTQTGALLSLCWAKAHGMTLMVQDLTNPMLAQIPHLLLAAHAGTIMGVETNSMQFYPDASLIEAQAHPGAYRRRSGVVDVTSIRGAGFGYGTECLSRLLPEPTVAY